MPRGVKGSGPKQAPQARHNPTPAPVVEAVVPRHEPPLGSLDVDSLSGQALRAYARRAGVLPRDVEHLSEDRLRQNTKIVIANHFDLITEG